MLKLSDDGRIYLIDQYDKVLYVGLKVTVNRVYISRLSRNDNNFKDFKTQYKFSEFL